MDNKLIIVIICVLNIVVYSHKWILYETFSEVDCSDPEGSYLFWYYRNDSCAPDLFSSKSTFISHEDEVNYTFETYSSEGNCTGDVVGVVGEFGVCDNSEKVVLFGDYLPCARVVDKYMGVFTSSGCEPSSLIYARLTVESCWDYEENICSPSSNGVFKKTFCSGSPYPPQEGCPDEDHASFVSFSVSLFSFIFIYFVLLQS